MDDSAADVTALRAGLGSALEEALRPLRGFAGPLGLLFSGGVDSSLLAWELRDRPGLLLNTLGTESSSDMTAGKTAAERLGTEWRGLSVGPADVIGAESRFEEELAGVSSVSRSVLLALSLAIPRAAPSRLVCGQGADELFLGYAHYRGLSPKEAEARSGHDLDRLRTVDWPRTQRIAEKSGKTIVAPYLSPEFDSAAQKVPIELRLPRDLPKRFFREWAIDRGLPSDLAFRPKKALQYGSGVSALIRRRARARR
jgi:asparagine synthase (glutamine-hydrolysing)